MNFTSIPFNSIRARLAIVVAIFIAISFLMAGLGWYIDQKMRTAQDMQENSRHLSSLMVRGHVRALTAMNHALLFRQSGNPQQADHSRTAFALALEEFGQGMNLLRSPRFQQKLQAPFDDLQRLQQSVLQFFELHQQLGLSETEGVHGKFREAAHQLEQRFVGNEDLQVLLLMMRRQEKDFIARKEPRYLEKFSRLAENVRAGINPVEAGERARLEASLEAYQQGFMNYAKLLQRENILFNEVLTLHNQRVAAMLESSVAGEAALDRNAQGVIKLEGWNRNLLLVGLPLGGLLIIFVQGYFSRQIYRGIHDAAGTINATVAALEKGEDSHIRMETEEHMQELEELAGSFNHLMTIIESLLEEVTDVSEHMLTVSTSTQQSASENNHSIQSQVVEIGALSQAINEMSAATQQMAETTQTAAEMVGTADQNARQGLVVMEESIALSGAVAQEISSTSKLAVEMDLLGDEVDSVMTVIHNITDQTSLLALNAAIEAARAGEVGRGFAVVADEVRTLAKKTSEATVSIQRTIEAVQSGIKRMVLAMESSTEQVEKSVDKGYEASAALKQIVESTLALAEMNQRIAKAAEGQNQGALNLRNNMNGIEDAAQAIAANTLKATSDSGDLSQFSEILRSLVRKIQGQGESQTKDDVELF